MSTLYKRFFDTRLLGAPYDRPDDHVLDMVRRCEMVLYAYLSCLDPSGRTEKIGQLLRTVTQPDRVRGVFAPDAAPSEVRANVLASLDKAQFHIDARTEASARRGDFLALQYVREVLRLTDAELFFLTLELLPAYDARFGPVLDFLRAGTGRGGGGRSGPAAFPLCRRTGRTGRIPPAAQPAERKGVVCLSQPGRRD